MISRIIQLVRPKNFQYKFANIDIKNKVLVRPEYLALCHADQRYYQGARPKLVLREKLPMALLHECSARVVYDDSGKFEPGQKVVLIPNTPPEDYDYKQGEFENYVLGGAFRSSGLDGFTQEVIALEACYVVPFGQNIDSRVASMTEFISVAVHASERALQSHTLGNEYFAVWGDGSLAYTMAITLRTLYRNIHLTVIGKHQDKLDIFTMADDAYLIDEVPEKFKFEQGFECVGGEGSVSAIASMIDHAYPQACITLMGVSENSVPINTRDLLEKGLTLLGASRSGRADFEKAIEILSDKKIEARFRFIIDYFGSVKTMDDLHDVFQADLTNPFKTVFKWEA